MPCLGVCEACSQGKTGAPDGSCAPVVPNTDPDAECPGNVDCQVAGVCGCPPYTGNQSIAGPITVYGFCWYLSKQGAACDATCADLGGANLAVQAQNAWADACSAVTTQDVTTMFYNQGNAGGWGNTTGATSYHTLGYGYANSDRYGKCASGSTMGAGTFPTDTNNNMTRAVVCPCFIP
jgi:hypothetical protein